MDADFIVYVKTDDAGRIVDINSSAFLKDADLVGWFEIARGNTPNHHHAQANYLEKPFVTERGQWRYRLVNGVVVERTPEELGAEYKPVEKDVFPVDVLGDHELRLCLLELGIGGEIV